MPASNCQRVVSTSSLRPLTPVRKPTSGSSRPKATKAVSPASLSARGISTRRLTPSAISHLLHVRPAEQALRQEDQRDGEHREGGDVLIVDGKIGRPHGFYQADEQAADHRARQR